MTRAAAISAVIVVPMLPPREVSPNFHGSWRKRMKAVAELRAQARWATRVTVDGPSRWRGRAGVVTGFLVEQDGVRRQTVIRVSFDADRLGRERWDYVDEQALSPEGVTW